MISFCILNLFKMLPPPSEEQKKALKYWVDKKNQVCSASAGSGKSTLLLHACLASTEPVLILAYNKPLASEMSEKLEQFGISHAQVFTFHGLSSRVFQLTPDDAVMHDTVRTVKEGKLKKKIEIGARRILIDEAQDMRDIYFELLKIIVPLQECQFLIVGDIQQMLYDYDEEDPARPDYMLNPQNYFTDSQWVFTRLSVSFRLTKPLAALANYLLDGPKLVAGSKRKNITPSVVITCSPSNWIKKVPIYIREALQSFSPNEIAILVPSVRSANGNRPVLDLINEMTYKGIPLYIHGSDGADPRISKGKVIVSTWHASKGTQYDFTIVLGVDEESKHNPLHVAVTRSKYEQIVVQDKKRPRRRLLEAVRDEIESVDPDEETEMLVERIEDLVPSSENLIEMQLKDLNTWSPRGRCVALHSLIDDISSKKMKPCIDLDSEIVVKGRQSWENVTQIYKRASLMCLEYYGIQTCQYMNSMLFPKYIHKNKIIERISSNDQQRFVTLGISKPQMLPNSVHELLSIIGKKTTKNEVDWLTLATAAESWCGYHHLCTRILPANWADATLLKNLCKRIRYWIGSGSDCQYDVQLSECIDDIRLYARCDIIRNNIAYSIIYEDDISPLSRLKSCIPMALCKNITESAVINIKNGEMRTYKIVDREQFLLKLIQTMKQ